MKHQNSLLFIANWKMQLSYNQAQQFCQENRDLFNALGQQATIVLCPSSTALSTVAQTFKNSPVLMGAQDCSRFAAGAYTGQDSAQSLADIGCTYCIVGHSERRQYIGETNEDVVAKVVRLIEHNICPIICIGETTEQYKHKLTLGVLLSQLTPLFEALSTSSLRPSTLCIAYEPIWAIGTGLTPTIAELSAIFNWLQAQTRQQLPTISCSLLYGGSINEKNVREIANVESVCGFLIGGASLDFQKFQNIVSLR